MIKAQDIGDMYRMNRVCERDSLNYKLSAVPYTFTLSYTEFFNPVSKKNLFKVASDIFKNGYPWAKALSNSCRQRNCLKVRIKSPAQPNPRTARTFDRSVSIHAAL